MPSVVFILFFLTIFSKQSHAQSAGPHWPVVDTPKHWIVDENSFHASFDTSYDVTTRNYQSNGKPVKPPTLLDANSWEHRLHFAYPILTRLSTFAQLSYRVVEDSFTQTPSGISGKLYRSGPADAMFAVRWLNYSNRRIGGRFSTAREIFPSSFRSVVESSLVLPTYSVGLPPLGNKSTDWQNIWRTLWFINSWVSLSSGIGYLFRSTPYSPAVPFHLRSDFYFPSASNLQVWLEWKGQKSIHSEKATQFSFTSGTILYGATSPTQYWVGTGLSFRAWKNFDIASSAYTNFQGQSAPRETIFTLGVVFRLPSEHSGEFFIPRGDMQIGGLASPADFQGYEWAAPVIQVTKGKENFFKITRGLREGVRMTDEYHVFETGDFTPAGKNRARFLGSASVVAIQSNHTTFKLQRAFQGQKIQVGDEVRCVKTKEPNARAKINP